MKEIFLIRHGETSHNKDNNRFSGITDVQMTKKGIEQCQSLSGYFTDKKVDKVYVSPLTRSIESAKNIFPSFQASFEVSDDLIEMNFGDREGFRRGAQPVQDEIIKKWETTPADLTFPNGDNVSDHADRVYNGLVRIARESGTKTIACVSHRTTIRLIIAKIMMIDLNYFRLIPCSNCSVTRIGMDNKESLRVITLNAELDLTGK